MIEQTDGSSGSRESTESTESSNSSGSSESSDRAGFLAAKVAIVTGASRGIGRAIALHLAADGAAVVMSGRHAETLDEVVHEIVEAGGRAIAVAAHAGEPGSAEALAESAMDAFGGVDILVNNAGTCPHYGPVLTADDAVWDKTMDVNVRSALRTAAACAPSMRSRGGGSIVNIASIAGLIPQPKVGLYCLSKAALVMLTKVLAAELAADGIRVNAIAPGFVRTRFSRAIWDDEDRSEETLRLIPQRRFGTPEDVAHAVSYLVADGAGFTTGTTIVIDGGQMVAAGLDT